MKNFDHVTLNASILYNRFRHLDIKPSHVHELLEDALEDCDADLYRATMAVEKVLREWDNEEK